MEWKKLTLLTLIMFTVYAAARIVVESYTRVGSLEEQREVFLRGKLLHERLQQAGVK